MNSRCSTRLVRLATRRPSFWRSPRIRSAPQSGFSSAMRRMRATVSAGGGGRPGPGRDLRHQSARKPARCQRSSVSGRTTSRAGRQVRMRPASSTRSVRSAVVMTGRLTLRCTTTSGWRKRAFSASNCPLVRRSSAPVRARWVAAGLAQRRSTRVRRTPARILPRRRQHPRKSSMSPRPPSLSPRRGDTRLHLACAMLAAW